MKTIGVTGPTGAGKTTALYALTDLGAHIVDADAVYHGLLANSISLREALTARFGEHICGEGGTIDRKRLGNLVFDDPEALADLNTITHRFVGEEIDRQLREAEAGGRPAAAIDAIALIESGLGRRIMDREGIPEDYARKRVSAQKGEDFFRSHCDYILENDEGDTPETFRLRARALFAGLLNAK